MYDSHYGMDTNMFSLITTLYIQNSNTFQVINEFIVCACAACSPNGVLTQEVVIHSDRLRARRWSVSIANNRYEINKREKYTALVHLFRAAPQTHP